MGFYIDYIPKKDNTHANALAHLASTLALQPKVGQKVLMASPSLHYPKQALEINKDDKQSRRNKMAYEVSFSMEPRD